MGGDWEEGEDEPFVVLGEVVSSDNGDHAFTIQRQVRTVFMGFCRVGHDIIRWVFTCWRGGE